MELEFKKFKILSDKRQFILRYENGKQVSNHYYTDLYTLLNALPNKILLKKESKEIDKLVKELRDLKKFIDFNFNK